MSNTAVALFVFWGVMLSILISVAYEARQTTYDGTFYGWQKAWSDFSAMNDWGVCTYLFVVGVTGYTIYWLIGGAK